LKYHDIDGFVYQYNLGVLTIRTEYPQLLFPPTSGCYLGCNQGGNYYSLGSCLPLPDNRYCSTAGWKVNECGDTIVRCNEVCEGVDCLAGCLSCKENYHAEGSLCMADTNDVVDSEDFAQTLSTAEEIRWTGSGWSAKYATACKANAVLDGQGICHCKTNYHEEDGECVWSDHYFSCGTLPVNTVWNKVEGYEQNWDGQRWVPVDSVAIYSETEANNACHYKCCDNSHRVGNDCVCDPHYITEDNICVPDSLNPPTYTCAAKPADGTEWNNGSSQTFNKIVSGSIWVPADGSMPTEYNETLLVSSCRYKCAAGFHRYGSACISDAHTYNCPAKPEPNTIWNTVGSLTQTWNIATSLWVPADPLTEYNETAVTNACHYVCNAGFNWTGTACVLCGNGSVNDGEECDDGNEINTDACDNTCKWTIWTGAVVVGTNTATASYMANGVNLDSDDSSDNSTDDEGGTNIKVGAITPTPYIWIAQSNGAKISKIRTFDGYKVTKDGIDTTTSEVRGQIVGIYATGGAFPSRTAVNLETGDVWVANRDGHSIRKFDIDGNIKKTCTTGFSYPRGVAIEQNGDVWIANSGTDNVVKISGDDTTCPATFTVGVNKVLVGDYPYGLAIDSNNNIWVVNRGVATVNGIAGNSVSKIDTITFAVTSYPIPGRPYGIAVDKDDNIWVGNYAAGGGVFKVSQGGVVTHIDLPSNYLTTAVTSDSNNNIWVSAVNNNCIYKYNQDTATASACLLSNGTLPHGIAGDSAGQIWSVHRTSGNVSVFNATSAAREDTFCVNGTINQVTRATSTVNPYTYSDMTGLNRAMLIRSGVYQEIINSGYQNQHWGEVTWVENITDTDRQSVEVSVRASNTLDANGTLPNGVPYQTAETWNTTASLRVGRYVEIKVLIRSRVRDNTPVVSDIQIVNP
jgi:cysteine-rich repeat protein